MKPFVIDRNTWHYKLNKNFMQEHPRNMGWFWEPRHSDFCSYWRATIFRVIAAIALLVIAVGFVFFIGSAFYQHPVQALSVLGFIIGFITLAVGFALITEKVRSMKPKTSNKPESLFVQKYRAHKSKICPMVEYK